MPFSRTQHGDACGDRTQDLSIRSDALSLRHRTPYGVVVERRGRASDSESRGPGFDPNKRHLVVSFSKTH